MIGEGTVEETPKFKFKIWSNLQHFGRFSPGRCDNT